MKCGKDVEKNEPPKCRPKVLPPLVGEVAPQHRFLRLSVLAIRQDAFVFQRLQASQLLRTALRDPGCDGEDTRCDSDEQMQGARRHVRWHLQRKCVRQDSQRLYCQLLRPPAAEEDEARCVKQEGWWGLVGRGWFARGVEYYGATTASILPVLCCGIISFVPLFTTTQRKSLMERTSGKQPPHPPTIAPFRRGLVLLAEEPASPCSQRCEED